MSTATSAVGPSLTTSVGVVRSAFRDGADLGLADADESGPFGSAAPKN